LKIYFATTVLGDRSAVETGRRVLAALQALGHEVLTEHLFEDGAFESDNRLTPEQIYDRDVAWLTSADVVIVEATGSSFGIGFETGYALGTLDIPVYLLYDGERADRVSRMATGLRHPRAQVVPYESAEAAVSFVQKTFR
jgi:nucleoside 2-deoxyribosyltransferase